MKRPVCSEIVHVWAGEGRQTVAEKGSQGGPEEEMITRRDQEKYGAGFYSAVAKNSEAAALEDFIFSISLRL